MQVFGSADYNFEELSHMFFSGVLLLMSCKCCNYKPNLKRVSFLVSNHVNAPSTFLGQRRVEILFREQKRPCGHLKFMALSISSII